MIIDMSNVKTTAYLGEGKHFVKIDKIEAIKDDYNNDVLKITFKDRDEFIFTDFFPLNDKMLWKLGALAKAVNVWDDGIDTLDTNHLLGKYLYITIAPYKNKDGKEYLTIKKFEPSKSTINTHNNEATVKQQSNNNQATKPIPIDDDEIPF